MRLQSRCWPRLQSSEGTSGAGGSTYKMAHSQSCWQDAYIPHCCWQEVLAPHQMNLSIGLLECLYNMAAGFPWSEWPKDRQQEGGHNAFYNLVPEGTLHHFYNILFIRNESLNLNPCSRGWRGGIRLHLFKSGLSRYVWMYFETSNLSLG